MEINKVAIIGAGRLGSRHLEGVLKYSKKLSVQVIEPFQSSVEQAKLVISQMNHSHDLEFYSDIESLDSDLDIVIVATNSKERKKVVEQLVKQKKTKHLILEKVLFQNSKDYNEIQNLIFNLETKVWVNHSRRQNKFYQEIKNEVRGKRICMGVWGNNWGLGCNALHFFDLFSYFTSAKKLVLETDKLDPVLHSAKRDGYNEFTGTIKGRDENNNLISITSFQGSPGPVEIIIYTDKKNYFLKEGSPLAKAIITERIPNRRTVESEFKMDFQSNLTLKLIEDIAKNEKCDLPSYDEAKVLHQLFITGLLNFMNEKLSIKTSTCPIT